MQLKPKSLLVEGELILKVRHSERNSPYSCGGVNGKFGFGF
jgi:hypothetical protein